MCSLLIGGNLLLLTSDYAEDLARTVPPEGWQRRVQERERRKSGIMSGLVSN